MIPNERTLEREEIRGMGGEGGSKKVNKGPKREYPAAARTPEHPERMIKLPNDDPT